MFKLVDDAFWGDVTKAFPSATRVKTIAAEIFMMQKWVAACLIVDATTIVVLLMEIVFLSDRKGVRQRTSAFEVYHRNQFSVRVMMITCPAVT